jgi:hypothetical protein
MILRKDKNINPAPNNREIYAPKLNRVKKSSSVLDIPKRIAK